MSRKYIIIIIMVAYISIISYGMEYLGAPFSIGRGKYHVYEILEWNV